MENIRDFISFLFFGIIFYINRDNQINNMATKYSTKTAKNFNKWRKFFQYITCCVIITSLRFKYNFKVEGKEFVEKKRKYIIASNHVTGIDPFIIAAMLNITIAYMAKKQLFETFWSTILMDWCGAFAVDRDKVDVSTIKTALSIQKTDWNLGLFPQGTRCNNGKIEHVAKGFASIAKKIKADVLPVGIIVQQIPNSKKKDFIIKVGKAIPYNDNVDNMVENWSKTVSLLSGLQYVPQ